MSYLQSPAVPPVLSAAVRACGHVVRRGMKSVAIGAGEVMAALASRA